jgi:7-cyano-7-deazaguanine reductase
MNKQDQNSTAGSLRRELETFNNPNSGRDYSIRIRIPEFTCLCPKTSQPDFATLFLDYIPEAACVELKSLKLYVWSFRDEGAFHEAVTNEILGDLVAAMEPRYARLTARFNVRGGVYTTIVADHRAANWAPKTAETLPPPVPSPEID